MNCTIRKWQTRRLRDPSTSVRQMKIRPHRTTAAATDSCHRVALNSAINEHNFIANEDFSRGIDVRPRE